MIDFTRYILFLYNKLGKLVDEIYSDERGGLRSKFSYRYDSFGNLIKKTYSDSVLTFNAYEKTKHYQHFDIGGSIDMMDSKNYSINLEYSQKYGSTTVYTGEYITERVQSTSAEPQFQYIYNYDTVSNSILKIAKKYDGDTIFSSSQLYTFKDENLIEIKNIGENFTLMLYKEFDYDKNNNLTMEIEYDKYGELLFKTINQYDGIKLVKTDVYLNDSIISKKILFYNDCDLLRKTILENKLYSQIDVEVFEYYVLE